MKRKIVLICGMSGAGLSTVLKTLEDLGYEAVDNLRLSMVGQLIAESAPAGRPLAVSLDSRNGAFGGASGGEFSAEVFLNYLATFRQNPHNDVQVLFLECEDEALQRRFNETRRRHPLALDRPIMDGIAIERRLLQPIRAVADPVIDTSLLSLHDLRRLVVGHYRTNQAGLSLAVCSFSYKHGLPREADLIFDVRFLRNPHWQADLRPLTGRDAAVADYVKADPHYQAFFLNLLTFLFPLLPRYREEGKAYLTVAIGCTGGRHRSVFVAEQLASMLAAQGYMVALTHRDSDRLPKETVIQPHEKSQNM